MISGIGKGISGSVKKVVFSGKKGFTLLELLIVMSLLAVMSAMAFPDMKRMVVRVRFQSVAERLHAVLDSLQERALLEKKIFHFSVDTQTGEYRTYEHDQEQKVVTHLIPDFIRIESDQDEILFYSDGSIDPARIVLAASSVETATFMTRGVFGGIKVQYQ